MWYFRYQLYGIKFKKVLSIIVYIGIESMGMRWAIIIVGTLILDIYSQGPVFGVGPATIYKDGIGMGQTLEIERKRKEQELRYATMIIYGAKEYLSIIFSLPTLIQRNIDNNTTSYGLDDIEIMAKYRIFKADYLGAQDIISFINSISLPTNASKQKNSVDYSVGITGGYQSQRWLYLGTLRYIFKDIGSGTIANILKYDLSTGIRLFSRHFSGYEPIIMLELSGQHNLHTSDRSLFFGPSFLQSLSSSALLKAGVQFPITQKQNNIDERFMYKIVFAFEILF